MKRKASTRSAFYSPRVVIALIISVATCCIVTGTLLAFLHPQAAPGVSQRTLTFEERVSYQRAIEDVYWRHRIWPKERSDPKPSLDAVMSQAQLEKKVTDYLRNSQALADYWQRPITAEQLKAEMDRMAKHTKQPDVLRELFEALGNDPFVIAECLARPLLAERLVTNWYAYDQRIHGELKQRAEAELPAHSPAVAVAKAGPSVDQMRRTSGKYTEIEFVKSDSPEIVGQAHRLRNKLAGGAPGLQQRDSTHTLKLSSRRARSATALQAGEWDETVQKLAVAFGVRRHVAAFESADMSAHSKNAAAEDHKTLPIGKLSSLQEDETRFYATAVVSKANDHLKLATVSWLKEPLQSWLARAENESSTVMAVPSGNYTLPAISGGGCIEDTWTATAAPPDPRDSHTAVWTGSEMIIWGGEGGNFLPLVTGGRYNPSTDSWTATNAANAPTTRVYHTAVWTGSEMIVWGGLDENSLELNTGGRYDPNTDTWTSTSTTKAPAGRHVHTAIWTGSEMMVWGGWDGGTFFNNGGRYNPDTDSWTATSTTNAPEGRTVHTAVWTGSEMLVWGGTGEFNPLNTGGRYNPVTNSWTATSTTNPPDARTSHTAVWTGSEMIIWGGTDDFGDIFNTGGKYNPITDSWTATTLTNAPDPRSSQTAVWTGSEMIVWGGDDSFTGRFNTGGRYNPSLDSWTATSTINAPEERTAHTAVWTGSDMIVWGGSGFFRDLNSGGRYDPNTDSWANIGHTPLARVSHTAIWTGGEMVVWGGHQQDFLLPLNTGAKYEPATDNWTATSITNAPDARDSHTAVWTGSEMIVWGGFGCCGGLETGGRYNPSADSWTATSTSNLPEPRYDHTAIWTGNEMIVWGGVGVFFQRYLNNGSRYDPSANTWTATSTSNAPTGRYFHTAVWSGSDMIVWGGTDDSSTFNTGGRYSPSTNGWSATSTTNVPSARDLHTAVWTGNEMIVWGGLDGNNFLETGGRYTPGANTWSATTTTNAPEGRGYHTAVWTGAEMIVWGGSGDLGDFNTGGRYNSDTDTWVASNTTNAPEARDSHTAIWSGSEMIVWGGRNESFSYLDTGGRYCVQSGPTPTPSPTPTPTATPRVTPRPRPTPHPRPTPR